MANLAMKHGYKPDDLASAAISRSSSFWGKKSNMWNECIEKYSLLCDNENGQIVEIGKIVCDYAEKQKENALEKEREEDIYGRY